MCGHYASQRSIHARFALFLRNASSANQNNFREDETHWSERNYKVLSQKSVDLFGKQFRFAESIGDLDLDPQVVQS